MRNGHVHSKLNVKGKSNAGGTYHIPQAKERAALQKMSPTRGMRPEQIPAGRLLLASMVAKGWIEKQSDGRTYCRTLAGDDALKALIPIKR